MLFLHETHRVIGRREDEFEAALRDAWLPELAKTSGARLLRALRHAHGSGPSYHLVTVTALRDAAAFEELVRRVDRGDLRPLAERLDAGGHDVEAKLLIPLPWSPLQEVDLRAVPIRPSEAEAASLLHGGHRLAPPWIPRGLCRRVGQPLRPRDGGALPGGHRDPARRGSVPHRVRQRAPPRGRALAAHRAAEGPRAAADARGAGALPGARYVDARRPRAARPVESRLLRSLRWSPID